MDAEHGDYARRTERIKNLLSSYYGGADGSQPSTPPHGDAPGAGEQVPSTKAPPGTLDSVVYNPERHISQMIKTYSLDKLLTEHRGMAREIKNLDSDMQQLVYENYNKFITATDTIRTLKTNVDGMDTDMDKLKAIMDDVAEKSNAVNQKLQKRRQHMEELNRVQTLLNKLQAVFDLPRRMRAGLEEDMLESAVSFYAEALPLLKKYGQRGAFKTVAMESELVAAEISAALKKRLADRKENTEQCVLLLRKLGEGDDTLQDKYLQGRGERMRKILKEGNTVVELMEAAGPGRPLPSSAFAAVETPQAWGMEEGGGSPSLQVFITALDERLINALQETVSNVAGIFLQGDRSSSRRKPLIAVCKAVMGEYFKLVRRAVAWASYEAVVLASRQLEAAEEGGFRPEATSLKFSSDWGAETVVMAMATVTTDMGQLHSQLPELNLKDWAAAATEQAVRGHIAAAFGAVEERISSAVKLLCTQLADANSSMGGANAEQAQVQLLLPAYNYMADAIQKGLTAVMQGFKVLEGQSKLLVSWQDQLCDAVQGQLQALFLSLAHSFMATAKVKNDLASTAGSSPGAVAAGAGSTRPATPGQASQEPPKTGLVLVLARLCAYMEGTTIPLVMELLANSTWGRTGRARLGDEPPPFMAGEVARRLGTAANMLLQCYVELHGRALSVAVRRSVGSTNWLQASEPRAPRPVCDLLLERLGKAESEVSRLVEATGRTAGAPDTMRRGEHSRGASAAEALESVAVERGVAKLFREKVKVFGEVKLTQAALMSAIAAVGLKSLVENIRLQTLGRAGLQQLQLDMYYLRPRLLRIAGGRGVDAVQHLLDEVVAAGAERSVDPSLLDPATMDRLLQAAANEQG